MSQLLMERAVVAGYAIAVSSWQMAAAELYTPDWDAGAWELRVL